MTGGNLRSGGPTSQSAAFHLDPTAFDRAPNLGTSSRNPWGWLIGATGLIGGRRKPLLTIPLHDNLPAEIQVR
jgi:hypothetical protein